MIGRPRRRSRTVPDTVRTGERVLAWAFSPVGEPVAAASREAVHLVVADGVVGNRAEWDRLAWDRLEWDRVHSLSWDAQEARVTVRRTGHGGASGASTQLHVDAADRSLGAFLELARERIAATVVLQRWTAVPGGRVGVVARRGFSGERVLSWALEVPDGVDASSEGVRQLLAQLLREAREEVGEAS